MENVEIEKNSEINNVAQTVLHKIQNGEVKMRSKTYFVVKVGILMFLTFFVFVFSVILVSFLLFSIKTGGYVSLLGFGARGIYKFLMVLPWFILILNALLLIMLDYLLRRFKFGYHSPVLYLFLGSLVFVTGLSYLVSYTPFHREIMLRAEGGRLPLGNMFYRDVKMSHRQDGIVRGEVVSIGKNYLIVKHDIYDRDSGFNEERVFFPDNMNLSNFVSVGDEVFIAIDMASGTDMIGYGVHRISGR